MINIKYFILAILLGVAIGMFLIPHWADKIVGYADKQFPHLLRIASKLLTLLKKAYVIVVSLLKRFFKWLTDTYSENDINLNLILDNREVLEIVDRLGKKVYESPTLVNYIPNNNAVSHIEINSVGLDAAHRDISNADIAVIACNNIQNYMHETRLLHVPIFIQVASPRRLVVEIPLSEHGRKNLEMQRQNMSVQENASPDILEEEIADISPQEEENEDWL